MKFLTLYMLMSVTACNAAAEYRPLSQQEDHLKHRLPDMSHLVHIIPGKKDMAHQIAFKPIDDFIMACLVADPNLDLFPADFAQRLAEQTREDTSKQSFRKIVDETAKECLPTELLIQGIASPKIMACCVLQADGINIAFFPTKVGSKPAYESFTSRVLITVHGGYPDSYVTCKDTEFYRQKHISILATRGEGAAVKKLALAHLEGKEFDLALNIDPHAVASFLSAHFPPKATPKQKSEQPIPETESLFPNITSLLRSLC